MPTLQTVERAFELLNLFSSDVQALGVKHAAQMLGLPASTTHRLLSTLLSIGVLEQNRVTSEYSLSLKLWEMGSLALRHLAIRDIARPYMDELCHEVKETVFLSTLEGEDILYLDRADGDQELRVMSRIGRRMPSHCISCGLAILAFSPPDVVDAVIQKGLEQYTPCTVIDPDALRQNLHEIRQRGFAVNVEGRTLGVSGVAAPILTNHRAPSFAISVSGPSARITEERHAQIGEQVRRTANLIAAASRTVGGYAH